MIVCFFSQFQRLRQRRDERGDLGRELGSQLVRRRGLTTEAAAEEKVTKKQNLILNRTNRTIGKR